MRSWCCSEIADAAASPPEISAKMFFRAVSIDDDMGSLQGCHFEPAGVCEVPNESRWSAENLHALLNSWPSPHGCALSLQIGKPAGLIDQHFAGREIWVQH